MRKGQNSLETSSGKGLGAPMGRRAPDGPLPLDSPFYVNHPSLQRRVYEEVRKPGALIRIRAPRQWGKTSLINRILAQAETYGG